MNTEFFEPIAHALRMAGTGGWALGALLAVLVVATALVTIRLVKARSLVERAVARAEERLHTGAPSTDVLSSFDFVVSSATRWPHELLATGGLALVATVFTERSIHWNALITLAPNIGPTETMSSFTCPAFIAVEYLGTLLALVCACDYVLVAAALSWLERRAHSRIAAALDDLREPPPGPRPSPASA
jgi:hypothetical protein